MVTVGELVLAGGQSRLEVALERQGQAGHLGRPGDGHQAVVGRPHVLAAAGKADGDGDGVVLDQEDVRDLVGKVLLLEVERGMQYGQLLCNGERRCEPG